MRKKLAVIGASYLQLPLVLKAKAMGIETLCFAWEDGAVCKKECDCFFPISIVEKEKILEICRRENIDGITSIASDVAVPTMAYIAEHLGLVGNSVYSSYVSTNKYAMRQRLSSGGVNCPAYCMITELSQAYDAAERIGFPVIVKPCDRSGSLGVSKVSRAEELSQAVGLALDASFSRTAILEQCIDIAQEISVEGISWKGEYQVLAVTDKTTTGEPHYVEIAQQQPSRLAPELIAEAVRQARLGVKALDILNGASHAELMISRQGEILVTEIGGRMGGDFIGSDLVRLSTGYDFLRGVIEIALNAFSGVKSGEKHCAGVWFYSQNTQAVKKWIDEKDRHPEIVQCELNHTELKPLMRSADRSGYFIYQNHSHIDWEQIETYA